MAVIGLGLAALGRPGYLNLGHGEQLGEDRSVAALRARTFEVLDAAYAAGVRDFDAARSYGRAEEFLGEWLRAHNPAGVRISSKWGYVYTAGWEVAHDPPEVKHHDLETFRRQLDETRENLGEWLTLYQIHSATPESGVLENDELLTAMQETDLPLGVSVSGTSQAETIDRALSWGCSTRSRRPGTCTSGLPRTPWPGPRPRGCASTSRRRWPTAGSRTATTSRSPPHWRSRGLLSC